MTNEEIAESLSKFKLLKRDKETKCPMCRKNMAMHCPLRFRRCYLMLESLLKRQQTLDAQASVAGNRV